jgi:hypothetical protein
MYCLPQEWHDPVKMGSDLKDKADLVKKGGNDRIGTSNA